MSKIKYYKETIIIVIITTRYYKNGISRLTILCVLKLSLKLTNTFSTSVIFICESEHRIFLIGQWKENNNIRLYTCQIRYHDARVFIFILYYYVILLMTKLRVSRSCFLFITATRTENAALKIGGAAKYIVYDDFSKYIKVGPYSFFAIATIRYYTPWALKFLKTFPS